MALGDAHVKAEVQRAPGIQSEMSEKRPLHGREVSSTSGPGEKVFFSLLESEPGGYGFYLPLNMEGHRHRNSQKMFLEQNIPNTFYLHSTHAFSNL